MITILVRFDKTGLITGYDVKGHANMADAGQDIICAAVSVITQSPVIGLEKHLHRYPRHETGEGSLKVELDIIDELSQTLMMTMLWSLKDLVSKYPGYIRIKELR